MLSFLALSTLLSNTANLHVVFHKLPLPNPILSVLLHLAQVLDKGIRLVQDALQLVYALVGVYSFDKVVILHYLSVLSLAHFTSNGVDDIRNVI